MYLKKGRLIPVGGKTVGKFSAIVRLDAFNGAGEGFYKVFHKQGGGIGAVFLKGRHKAPPGILINGGILEKMLPNHLLFTRQAEGTYFTSTWIRCPGWSICS